MPPPSPAADALTRTLREHHATLMAALGRATRGDLILAEDALQQTALAALEQWGDQGVPDRPVHWLLRVGRNKLHDRHRRSATHDRHAPALTDQLDQPQAPSEQALAQMLDDATIPDERLRLLCACCHPALALEARVALTLRVVGGLTTDEIARLCLVEPPTMAQRIVRAKRKIRDAGVPYSVPPIAELPARVAGVMHVLYLIFTEGYAASGGDRQVRGELCTEAVRLGAILADLLPTDGEVLGLLSLMLLQDARRHTRTDADGGLVLLEDQDRQRWSRRKIVAGMDTLGAALKCGPPGPYTLQAAIASVHARALRASDTDWHEIALLYDILDKASPSPIVRLNGAVAWAMAEGPASGLRRLDPLDTEPSLHRSHLLPAARSALLLQMNRHAEAAAACQEALERVGNAPERRLLEARLQQCLYPGS